MINLNRLTNGAWAGVVIGILLGMGARLSMRVVAVAGGMQPNFSLGGTLGILVLFAALGLVWGLLFIGMGAFVPLRTPMWGVVYGLLFGGLTAIPFLTDPGGELALAAPWLGVLLFAPLPLLGGILLGQLTLWLDQRPTAASPRLVNRRWLAAGMGALVLAIMGIGSLLDGSRIPRALWDLVQALGISFNTVNEINGLLGMLFLMGYVGSLLALFLVCGHTRAGRGTVVALLLFAAGFFNRGVPFTSMMDSLRLAAIASALVQAAGATGLLLLLCGFPDGEVHGRWLQRARKGVAVAALIWFGLPVVGINANALLPAPLRLAGLIGIMGGGLWMMWTRWQRSPVALQRQIIGPVLGFTVALLWFLGLWAATLIVPDLGFSAPRDPFAPLSVTLYLMPWLLPPLLILHAVLRRGLWQVIEWKTPTEQTHDWFGTQTTAIRPTVD